MVIGGKREYLLDVGIGEALMQGVPMCILPGNLLVFSRSHLMRLF